MDKWVPYNAELPSPLRMLQAVGFVLLVWGAGTAGFVWMIWEATR